MSELVDDFINQTQSEDSRLAKQLETLEIPIHLTIQIDSVGRGDAELPSNVSYAANIYQTSGRFIKGENLEIRL